jgi:CDP-diacylglycerol pyrophosphatase
VAFAAAIAVAGVRVARAADPSALWHIVHNECVPRAEQGAAPAPCAVLDRAAGYAILKDLVGATQFLLIPTARVSGIEDPAILAPGTPNYWQQAWHARDLVEQNIGHPMPRDTMSLAINSAYGRTQDQLHIHIDCIRPDVRDTLAAYHAAIGPHWAAFPVPLAGEHYRAMRLDQGGLGSVNPFRLLARDVPQKDMGQHTLVLVGAEFSGIGPGFILLDDRVNLASGDQASGESLQDHDCAVAR